MGETVFVEVSFWLLVTFSLLVPVVVYGVLLLKLAISRIMVVGLGLTLVAVAGLDLYFLQRLSAMARLTPSSADDAVFLSEVTVGLYILPALFAGLGVNVISHVLIRYLSEAEK